MSRSQYFYINISRKKSDKYRQMFQILREILYHNGGHKRDKTPITSYQGYLDPHNENETEMEDIWSISFHTKNISNRHKKIFEHIKSQFSDRNVFSSIQETSEELIIDEVSESFRVVSDFIDDINIQRLNEKEKKELEKINKIYKIENSPSFPKEKKRIIKLAIMKESVEDFNVIEHFQALENHPDIDTINEQNAVKNILKILNQHIFISNFIKVYQKTNKAWFQQFNWHLFKETDRLNDLNIPIHKEGFYAQIGCLNFILADCLDNSLLKKKLKELNISTEDNKGESTKSLESAKRLFDRLLPDTHTISFLKLLNSFRGKVSHSAKSKENLQTDNFLKVVNFCKDHYPIYKSDLKANNYESIFRAILQTTIAILEEAYLDIQELSKKIP